MKLISLYFTSDSDIDIAFLTLSEWIRRVALSLIGMTTSDGIRLALCHVSEITDAC
jgi:hypothetical protein